ncbi:MAG: UDP-2,3-diacylglucosamine diphosphatase [Bdellovibrionota bacterium]
MKAYFLSDIHLKSVNERNGEILLRFFNSLIQDPDVTHLFLLGDIFDLWVSGGKAFVRKYEKVVAPLFHLEKKGVEIIFFEGNHDLHIDPYWEKVLGAQVFQEAQYFHLQGLQIRLEHGDLINLEDKNYLKLRSFWRNPIVEFIGHLLPGFVWMKVGDLWSPKSRKKSAVRQRDNSEQIRQMIRFHASRAYAEAPFDAILTGHMHVKDDYVFEVEGKKVRSINLGSWYQEPCALLLENSEFRFVPLS